MKRILAHLSAHKTIGLGHAVRTGALLKSLPFSFEMTVAGQGDLWRGFMPEGRHIPVADDHPQALAAAVEATAPNLILVDFPTPCARRWQALAGNGCPIAAILDESGLAAADLVMNGTVLESLHHYHGLRPGGRVLAGAPYALLRPPFAQHPWTGLGGSAVTAVIGSGQDAADWAFFLSNHWPDHRLADLTLVVGSAFPDMPGLRAVTERRGIAVRQNLSAEQLALRLSQSGAALITGGMILYEAACIGVPSIVFPQIPNCVPEADWFTEARAVINLGLSGGQDMPAILQGLARLQGDEGQVMSQRLRSIIDGQGLRRAAEAIGSLVGL